MTPIAEAHPAEEFLGPLLGRFAAEFEGHLDVLPGRERRDQMERLEDEADLLGPELGSFVFSEAAEIGAVEGHPAAAGPVEPREQAEERGLAAARGPDDREEAAALEGERDIVQHRQPPAAGQIGLREAVADEHGGVCVVHGGVNDSQFPSPIHRCRGPRRRLFARAPGGGTGAAAGRAGHGRGRARRYHAGGGLRGHEPRRRVTGCRIPRSPIPP
ncbi:MAG: hypothetical protein R2882_07775 [Gemmatimonadales bacterium]